MERTTAERAAWWISELYAPAVVATAYLLSRPLVVPGIGWPHALVAVLFTTVLPFLGVLWFARGGVVSSRHIPKRRQRYWPFLTSGFSILGGVWTLRLMDAPDALFLDLGGIFTGLVLCLVANAFYKVSVHTAVAVYVALQFLGPVPAVGVAGLAAAAAVGWSRHVLRAHTPGQVAAGAAIGVATHLLRTLVYG
ncbi:hypothetical protein ACQ7DA_06520 [Zafaria sp. J156]|uniref:hypothetical protein n=1 Tax=Zafaria sp. J156 TaxID=3116490 RepID=UPI002E79878C|nr:hypothetical protein [Zafaria sp. J156]MEE1620974.1 hypothetical protein [Zafaria sp. J156]